MPDNTNNALNRFDALGDIRDDGVAVVTGIGKNGRWFALAGNGDWCFVKPATARSLVAMGAPLVEKAADTTPAAAEIAETDLG